MEERERERKTDEEGVAGKGKKDISWILGLLRGAPACPFHFMVYHFEILISTGDLFPAHSPSPLSLLRYRTSFLPTPNLNPSSCLLKSSPVQDALIPATGDSL